MMIKDDGLMALDSGYAALPLNEPWEDMSDESAQRMRTWDSVIALIGENNIITGIYLEGVE